MELLRFTWILLLAIHKIAIAFTEEDCGWLTSQSSGSCETYLSGNVPPLVILSLGGFRPDYLARMQHNGRARTPAAPTIACLASEGVHAPYMMPTYPTLTYPNLYSIATGLYPNSHGIVADKFYDSVIKATFSPSSKNASDPRWWLGEPIWTTARKQGKKSAVDAWPGSNILDDRRSPTYTSSANRANKYLRNRIDQVLKWLEMPLDQRPAVIMAHFEDLELMGKVNGPSSQRVTNEIKTIDTNVRRMMDELRRRNISNCINIIIVSDRGMADWSRQTFINLHNLMGLPDRAIDQHGAPVMIRSENGPFASRLIQNMECKNPHVKVLSKWDLPYRMHLAGSNRIPDLMIDLDLGWRGYSNRLTEFTKGNSGWDNLYDEMHAIFVAYGPSIKKRQTIGAFENIHLYNLMCYLLKIEPASNDGLEGAFSEILANPTVGDIIQTEYELQILRQPGIEESTDQSYRECDSLTNLDQMIPRMSELNETLALQTHAPLGVPIDEKMNDTTVLLINSDYITGFDVKQGRVRWTSYTIRRVDEVEDGLWRLDPRLTKGFNGTCERLGYKQNEKDVLFTSFPPMFATQPEDAWLDTNIVDGPPDMWNATEKFNKILAQTWIESGSLNVVTGPTLAGYDAIFYVVSSCEDLERFSLNSCPFEHRDVQAFVLPKNMHFSSNCSTDYHDFIAFHVATLYDVEQLAGLTFFPDLPPGEKRQLLMRTTLESQLVLNPARYSVNYN